MNLHQEVIMKGTLLVKNVKHLVTCDGDDRLLDGVDVFIRDGVIAGIGQEAGTLESGTQESGTAEDVIDASNMVMYPGLINTHHHLYQTFSRNLPQVQNMELFPWLKTLYEIWKHVDEDVVCYSALTGMGELLKTGCTTCLDHHYVFPGSAGDGLLDAQFGGSRCPGNPFPCHQREYGFEREGRRTASGQRGADRGPDSEGFRTGREEISRQKQVFHAPGGVGTLLPFQRDWDAFKGIGTAGQRAGSQDPHPSG